MSWKRSEPRIARPFFAVSHLNNLLDQCYLMVGDHQYEPDLETVSVDPEMLMEFDVSVVLAIEADRLFEFYEDSKNLIELQIVLRDPMLKRRKVMSLFKPMQEVPSHVTIPANTIRQFSHARELQIIISLVVANDCPEAPGFPRNAGEWLAKRTFKLAVPSQITNFRIHEMTPEQAKRQLGSEGALVYVEYRDGALTSNAEDGVPVAECFVAKRLLDRLKGRNSRLVNSKISTEIIYWILRDAADEIREIDVVDSETPLDSVIKQLSSKREVNLAELKSVLGEPRKLRALLEDRFNLIEIIGGGQ